MVSSTTPAQNGSYTNTPQFGNTDFQFPTNCGSAFSEGLSQLYKDIDKLRDDADAIYEDYKTKAQVARDTNNMAKKVGTAISECAKKGPNSTAKIPQDVINYMRKNGIKIEGYSIDDFIKKYQKKGEPGKLDQSKLTEVKDTLTDLSGRATDFVSQSQLKLERLTQTYSVIGALLNSMQTLLSDTNKTISQNIR